MGIVRKLRAFGAVGRAANEVAAAAGAPPQMQRGMVAGFANVMAQAMAPQMAANAERRGGPLPGSDPAVTDGSAWSASVVTGADAIRARDAAFDVALLADFGQQVFAAVAAVWTGTDSATVRPVMCDEIWEPLAAATGPGKSVGGLNPFARLGPLAAAEATGLHAGSWYDSAMIVMRVQLTGQLPRDFPPEWSAWDEDWLFQRSVQPGGDPMIHPPACPACGAPTQVDGAGLCTHCRAPVPFLTTGWLVSGIVSHQPIHAMMRERLTQAMAANPEAFANLANLPPAMRAFFQQGTQL
jgi:hypothetical protein